MSDERKIFLYFLTDPLGRSYYYENGVVNVSTTPVPLDESPGGWLDQGISIGRNQRYHGLNRTYSQPLKFVDDGATIIRNLFYKKKGINERLILIVLKWDDETDIYELEFKGELDLGKMIDFAAEGIEVNIMEGGVIKLLKSYENTVYEYPCDGSIPENKLVKLDGILFNDKLNYRIVPIAFQGTKYTIPIVFLSNDGYNANAAFADQQVETFDNALTYVSSSGNYFFKYFRSTSVRVYGKIKFRNADAFTEVLITLWNGAGSQIEIFFGPVNPGQTIEIDFDETFTNDNDALFLTLEQGTNESFVFEETSVSIEFKSRFDQTNTWAISARDLWTKIVDRIGGGQYTAVSTLLDQYPNLMLTSGDAIRQTTGAVLKTSLGDFFDSINAVLNACLGNQQPDPSQPEQLFIERKGYVFNPETVTLDMGQVSDLKITIADQFIFNSVKVGYAPQSYDDKSGRQEYNTTAVFNTQISRLQKELNLVSKYRADAFGVEFTRIESPGKSTTKNSSDNSVFFLNVDSTAVQQLFEASMATDLEVVTQDLPFESIAGPYFTANTANTAFTFSNGGTALNFILSANVNGNTNIAIGRQLIARLMKNEVELDSATFEGTGSSSLFFLNLSASPVTLLEGDVISIAIEITGSITPDIVEVTSANLLMLTEAANLYELNRETYDDISGVDNPDTIFNVADLTPGLMVRRHGNYIRGVMHNLVDTALEFQTLDKNKELARTVAGVTTIEKANIPIGQLDAPLFYPYIIECKANMPLSTVAVFQGAANGYVRLEYNGKVLYGFPLEVSVKPALNESQEIKLLMAPQTNLNDLVDLDVDGLNYNIMGQYTLSIPHLCPVKFVPLNPTLDPKYHFVQMDDNWFQNQVRFYIAQAKYYQKYQMNDTAKIQVRTNGLGPCQIDVYDCHGAIVETIAMDQITTPAVVAPNALFEASVPFADYDEGIYAMVITAGTGETVAQVISEMIYVKADWPMTLLFEYTNNRNKQSTVFSEGYAPSFRVEGWIDDFSPASKFATYEDQPADIQLLNGIPFRRYRLNIGCNDGVPPWVIDKINRIMLLTDTAIDGLAYTRNADAQFEKVDVPGWPMKYWSLDVREAANRDSVSVGVDGEVDTNLTVVYNLRSIAFGDGSNDGVVQVTSVD